MQWTNPQRKVLTGSPWSLGLLCAVLVLAVAAPVSTARAEEPEQKTDESSEQKKTEKAEAEKPALEVEVKVTARKREENVQEVPVAVSVVQGEVLEDQAAEDLSVVQQNVPNLAIYAGRNQSTTLTAFLRGIGQADPLWGVDPGVGLYLDDVYIARPQGALLDVFDVDRIEVLRGPQGTLYGKNTIGGAIKYVSRRPTDEFEARIAGAFGEFGRQDFKGSISGPLVPGKLRAKVAFASLQRDGYGRNLFQGIDNSDKDTTAYRVSVDFIASDRFRIELSHDKTDDNANPKGYARLAPNPFCPLFLGQPCGPLGGLWDTESGLEPVNGTEATGYAATATWDINDDWTFKSITAYRETDSQNNIDFDTTPARIADVRATYYDDQTSQEFQLIYDGGRKLSGVFGLYYFDGKAGGDVFAIFFEGINPGTSSSTQGFVETESRALFFDGSYALTDRLTLNAGLRYTDEDKHGVAFNRLWVDPDFTTVFLVAADYDKTANFTSLSPRIGLDYDFTDDVMGYVSISRGFKSGGFNIRAQSNFFPSSAEPFDDEKLTMAEVGVKSVLGGGQGVLNTAVFWGDYTDVQVSTFTDYDSDGDGTNDSFFGDFLNAGDATLKGVEVEFAWAPRGARWFRLNGYVSYLDAKPDSFIDRNRNGLVDTQVITNAPEWTGSLTTEFNAPTRVGVFTGGITYAYRDDSVLTNEGDGVTPITQEAYGLLNARVGWISRDSRWAFNVVGTNLTDEEYLTSGYNLPVLGILTGSYGAPRQVTATLEYRFD
ncbi:MAG: TonB-dependent receptor [Acidobacteria bacterium]|nr:MAG: TonB-dependent receptor [Acidobacteriota bacterium]